MRGHLHPERERYKLTHFPIAGIRSLQKQLKEGRVYFGPQEQVWSIMGRKARCQERGAAGGIASTVRKQMNAGGRLAFSFSIQSGLQFMGWCGPHSRPTFLAQLTQYRDSPTVRPLFVP